ncbi:MAG TPA: hypothetical protein VF062_00090, partial [Candidatus Limnocylindrales bacterium]
MTAPQVPDSASPFWLRLYGHWVRLQGIMPVVDKASERAFSELTTVDGHRYEQRAPRGPRSWALDYRYATAAATAALESAAYDYNFDDPSMRTLLLDTNEAKINMVPPDLAMRWRGIIAGTPEPLNVGEDSGLPMWLPTYGTDSVSEAYRSLDIPVRAGVTYTITNWYYLLGNGTTVLSVSGAASGSALSVSGGTAAAPRQATLVRTPASDGVLTVETRVGYSTGLMVYEGNCAPTSYRAGRGMPCSISVRDASTKTNLIW